MCGIILAFNDGKTQKGTVNKEVIDTLQDQIGRGKEGFGIIFVGKGNKVTIERSCEITKTMLDLYKTEARMIIMHHRTPTSSNNKLSQTHPLIVDNGSLKYKYAFIHNGMISNAEDVKKAHEKLGFEYTTEYKQEWSNAKPDIKFNDSECLAIELARFAEKQTDTLATMGSVAFIGIQIDKKTNKALKVFFGRNTSPLNLSASKGKIRLASEGKGNPILGNMLYTFEPTNYKLHKNKMEIAETSYYRKTITPSTTKAYDSESGYHRIGFHNEYDYDDRYTEMNCGKSYNVSDYEKLEDKLEETVTDGQIIYEKSLTEFTDKLIDPVEILGMDIEEEIKSTIKEVIITLRDMYTKNCEIALEASYETAADEVKKEHNQPNTKTNVNNKESDKESDKKINEENKVKKDNKVEIIANQECLLR